MADRPTDEGGPRRQREGDLAGWYRMAGVGMEFVAAVALFGGIGWLLDRWLGTGPWLVLAGVGVGFAVGLYMMVRMAMRSFRADGGSKPTGPAGREKP